jgi:pyridoxine 5-phosphate synthase
MTLLSVNLNKIALIRNSRPGSVPSVMQAARTCVAAGAAGITVHPRPDERHIRFSDVHELAEMLSVEFNIEGNPLENDAFMDTVLAVKPTQCTLVPDKPGAKTSDHGWDLESESDKIGPLVRQLQESGIRVSLFMDPDLEQIPLAREVGTDRIELYTEAYAAAFGTDNQDTVHQQFLEAAACAQKLGLGVNAGHDLNVKNLATFVSIPDILEVSIGHALIADALEMGLANAVKAYLDVLGKTSTRR